MILEILRDFGSFHEISGDFFKFCKKKSAKIRIITDNSVKKRKEIIKKVLKILFIFVIINPVKL